MRPILQEVFLLDYKKRPPAGGHFFGTLPNNELPAGGRTTPPFPASGYKTNSILRAVVAGKTVFRHRKRTKVAIPMVS